MRLEFFPLPFLAGIGILLSAGLVLWLKKHNNSHLIFVLLFGFYLLILAGLTLFPVPVFPSAEKQPVILILSKINLVPFRFGGLFFLHPFVISYEIVGNMILTIPFGFGLIFVAPKAAGRIIGWLLGIGFAIELSQLLASIGIGLAYRGVDINDVLLNDLGALIGFGFFRLFAWAFIKVKLRFGFTPKGFLAYVDDVVDQALAHSIKQSTTV